jgi:hypothetical protein
MFLPANLSARICGQEDDRQKYSRNKDFGKFFDAVFDSGLAIGEPPVFIAQQTGSTDVPGNAVVPVCYGWVESHVCSPIEQRKRGQDSFLKES